MNKNKKAFTLVELLVVITIIAILWVVAYTQFGWATDKAKTSTKISNINTISQALSMYKTEKWFYPKPAIKSSTNNIWWYDSSAPDAKKTCVTWLSSDSDWKLIWSITNISCWWVVKDSSWNQIWAKWTLAYSWAIKKYLKKDAYDNQIWDLELSWTKLIEYWIGRFPYATYAKWINNNDKNGLAYNMAYTIRESDWTEVTKIVWDFNDASCSGCPNTLIWSNTDFLKDWDKAPNIPYKINF
jgi:prepilin-type N-terminal cleavage/methylation domain-containing protein